MDNGTVQRNEHDDFVSRKYIYARDSVNLLLNILILLSLLLILREMRLGYSERPGVALSNRKDNDRNTASVSPMPKQNVDAFGSTDKIKKGAKIRLNKGRFYLEDGQEVFKDRISVISIKNISDIDLIEKKNSFVMFTTEKCVPCRQLWENVPAFLQRNPEFKAVYVSCDDLKSGDSEKLFKKYINGFSDVVYPLGVCFGSNREVVFAKQDAKIIYDELLKMNNNVISE